MCVYGAVLYRGGPRVGRTIEVHEDRLKDVLSFYIRSIPFDESWYVGVNDDVRNAINIGDFKSGADHYQRAGYFENRMPRAILVVEKWYLNFYPDVSEAVRAGRFVSGQDHFNLAGFKEGRLASEGWSLGGEVSGAKRSF